MKWFQIIWNKIVVKLTMVSLNQNWNACQKCSIICLFLLGIKSSSYYKFLKHWFTQCKDFRKCSFQKCLTLEKLQFLNIYYCEFFIHMICSSEIIYRTTKYRALHLDVKLWKISILVSKFFKNKNMNYKPNVQLNRICYMKYTLFVFPIGIF